MQVRHSLAKISRRVDGRRCLRPRCWSGRHPASARRLSSDGGSVDGVAADAEASGDGRLGQTLAMEEPMNLGPVLHLVHSFLPRHELLLARGCQSIWSGVLRFRPAECAQFWTGVDTPGTEGTRLPCRDTTHEWH